MEQSALSSDIVERILKALLKNHKIKLNPVKLELEYEPVNMTVDEFFEMEGGCMFDFFKDRHDLTPKQVKQVFTERFPKGLTWDYVPFAGVHKLNVHQGCVGLLKEYGYKDEDFAYEINSHEDLTIKQYLEGVYRMKIQKYDNWHELFLNADFKFDGETVGMTVNFDYGN
jgi:hypothetical protein